MRLDELDYTNANYYFVTIVCHNRRKLMIDYKMRTIVESIWLSLPERFENVLLDQYKFLPNHMHGIVIIQDRLKPFTTNNSISSALPEIIRNFKGLSTFRANKILNRSGQPFWQRSYHDHILRNEHDLHEIRKYIKYNHLKHRF